MGTYVFITFCPVEAAQAAASQNGRGVGGRPPRPLDMEIEALFQDTAVLLAGDKGFDSDKLRKELEALGHRHLHPGQGKPEAGDRILKTLLQNPLPGRRLLPPA